MYSGTGGWLQVCSCILCIFLLLCSGYHLGYFVCILKGLGSAIASLHRFHSYSTALLPWGVWGPFRLDIRSILSCLAFIYWSISLAGLPIALNAQFRFHLRSYSRFGLFVLILEYRHSFWTGVCFGDIAICAGCWPGNDIIPDLPERQPQTTTNTPPIPDHLHFPIASSQPNS